MTDDVEFRRASGADRPGIWAVFTDVVSTADTYTFPPDITEQEALAAWVHLDGGRTVTYVAVAGPSVVGTALLRPNLGGLGDHVANAGWMVSPSVAGRGIGRRFAEFVMDEARSLGFTAMQFNAVVATNERAIRLWRSLGFGVVGRVPGAFRHGTAGPTDLLIMHREL